MTAYAYIGYGACGHLTMLIAESEPTHLIVECVTKVLALHGLIERVPLREAVARLQPEHCTCKPTSKPTLRSVP